MELTDALEDNNDVALRIPVEPLFNLNMALSQMCCLPFLQFFQWQKIKLSLIHTVLPKPIEISKCFYIRTV